MYYSEHQVRARHNLLRNLIGTKPEEDKSLDSISSCLLTSTVIMVSCGLMETVAYFLYSKKVLII